MKYKKLFWQIFPSFIIFSILSFFLIIFLSYSILREHNLDRISTEMRNTTLLVENYLIDLIDSGEKNMENICFIFGTGSGHRVTLINKDGFVVCDNYNNKSNIDNYLFRVEIQKAKNNGSSFSLRSRGLNGKEFAYFAKKLKKNGKELGYLRISSAVKSINDDMSDIFLMLVVIFVFIVLTQAYISLIVARSVKNSVDQLKHYAINFANGIFDFDLSLGKNASYEIVSLGHLLKKISSQLQERLSMILSQKVEQEAVFSSMTEGVLAVDKSLKVIQINNQAINILKLNDMSPVGKKLSEVSWLSSKMMLVIKKSLEENKSSEGDFEVNFEGNKKFIHLKCSPLNGKNSLSFGVVVLLLDQTKVKKLERHRSEFLANFSHELRTPLTSIKGFSETLLNGDYFDDKQKNKFIKIIVKHSDRLCLIIDDILSLSRLDRENKEQKITKKIYCLKKIVDNSLLLCKSQKDKKKCKILTDVPENISVDVDFYLFEQALVNLITNAIKYGGEIIKISSREHVEKGKIIISVSDNGPGIEPKHLDRLFERFYRVDNSFKNKEDGTGLGLAIVKHIVLIHSGKITVSSKLDEGTVFEIQLPILKNRFT